MSSLTGQLLVAMPQLSDPYFDHSIVFLCAHSEEEGSMGLIVNKTIDSLTMLELYEQLEIAPVMPPDRPQPVHFGGPVATDHGFMLHSGDYQTGGTMRIGEFALTATVEILRAMAEGGGPRQCLVALGYAGWGPGQLEAEIQANGWLSVAADTGLVFDADDGKKWQRALAKLGVTPEMLSSGVGHA